MEFHRRCCISLTLASSRHGFLNFFQVLFSAVRTGSQLEFSHFHRVLAFVWLLMSCARSAGRLAIAADPALRYLYLSLNPV